MITMFLVVFLFFGALAYIGMSVDLMPVVDIPYITVQTTYPGSGPKEIETQVTKKIEDEIASVSKIDEIISYSMEGISLVLIKFEMGKDANIAKQEVKDKIDAILNELPDDAKLPLVQKINLQEEPILDIALTGNLPITELYDLAETQLKDRFAQIEGVARVNLVGGQEREIQIEMNNRTVFQNNINLSQLSQILRAQNLDMPGGNIDKNTQEYSIRLDGEFDDVQSIENLKIPTAFGIKRLKDIAEINDTGEEVRERTTYFNNLSKVSQPDVVLMSIVKNSEGNTVEIAKAIQDRIPQIEQEIPANCKLDIVMDASNFIQSSVNDTLNAIILGIILTGLVLLFFLHDLRSTIIVALSMPMSIISAFLFMQFSGFTLNIMSLMGLSTAVGVLVTNSVVVLENIFRHKAMGNNRSKSASKGTAEVVVAVVASAMTNIAVFLPIAMMSSLVGQFFKEFALAVTYTTIFSLLISFTLTPMLASLILPEHDQKKHPLGHRLEKMFRTWEKVYQKMLTWLLVGKKRALIIIASGITLFIVSLPIGAKIGFEFIPAMDDGDIRIEVELPEGYNLDETANLLQTVEDRLKPFPEVKHLLTTLGRINNMNVATNMALIKVKLVQVKNRNISNEQAASLFIAELDDIPNARLRVMATSSAGGYEGAPILFYMMGQDVEQLEVYKNELLERISTIPGLVNLNTSSRAGKPEIRLNPNRQKIAEAGVTVYDLAMTLRSAITGVVATQYKEDGEEYDIRVIMNDKSVDTPEKIGNLILTSHSGKYRLSQLTEIGFADGYSKIMHKNKYKTIEFSASTSPEVPLGEVTGEIENQLALLEFPPGYQVSWGGDTEMMQETTTDMLRTFLIAILLTYMLLAAILESLTQPLMILGTVPLALIGVFAGMFITGSTMNIISMLAIVMLLGIVVNNAILLLDYTNELRRSGKSVADALIEACPTKLKPILMSTIAIILAMLPMAMGFGDAGREIREPMGIVAISGLIVSTFFTLFIIPAVYRLVSKEIYKAEIKS